MHSSTTMNKLPPNATTDVGVHTDAEPPAPSCCTALERGLADLRSLAEEHSNRGSGTFSQLFDAVRQRGHAADPVARARHTHTAKTLLRQLVADVGNSVGQDVLLTVAVHLRSLSCARDLLAAGASPLMRVAHFGTLQAAVFLREPEILNSMLQRLACPCMETVQTKPLRCTDVTDSVTGCLCMGTPAPGGPDVQVAYGKADCGAIQAELVATLTTATLLDDATTCRTLLQHVHIHARFAAALPTKLPDMVGKLYHTAAPLPFLAAAMGHTDLLQAVLLPAALQEARLGRPAVPMGIMHDGMLDNEGWTLLMTAACSGHADTVLMLCQLGAGLGLVTKIERSALWLAALRGHAEVCRMLLEAGADVELAEECGFTPLLVAAAQGHTDTVAMLCQHGARMQARTKNGATAALLACRYARVDVLRWLLANGGAAQLSATDGTSAFAVVARELGQPGISYTSAAAYRQVLERGLVPTGDEARDVLISMARAPCRDGWQTAWQVLTHTHSAQQLAQLTSVEPFYLLPRGMPPAQPALKRRVVEILMQSVVQMLSSFLYNLAPESSLGRRPAYLLTMAANALTPDDVPAPWLAALMQLWEQTLPMLEVLVLVTCEGPASTAVLGTPDALLGRLGNLLTAFHDARRLLWPAKPGAEADAGQPMADALQLHAAVLNSEVTAHASDLVAWHFLLHYSQLLQTPLKHALLRSEIRIAHGPDTSENHPPNSDAPSVSVTVEVQRDAVLESMCDAYSEGRGLGAPSLREVAVKFAGESGVGDGLRREWLSIVARQCLSLDHGLMESPDGGRTFQPSPHSNVHEGHLAYFQMMGRVCGLALLHGAPLPGFHLTRPLRRLMLHQDLDSDDLHVVDAQMASALQMIAEGGLAVEDLCLTFVARDALGREVELLPGGAAVDVTDANRHQYISLLTQHKLLGAVREQTDAFLQGWRHVLPSRILDLMSRCLSVEELDVLLAGLADIDVEDWQQHTRYVGCEAGTPQVEWLWAEVMAMPHRERALLLAFVTGSSAPPAGGFAELLGFNGGRARFAVHLVAHEGGGRLPRARTCFNALYLPTYASRAELSHALHQAIHAQTLFDESLWH